MNENYQDLAVKVLRIVALIVVAAGTVAAAGIVLSAFVALAIMLVVCLLALFLIKPSAVKELAGEMADRLDDWLEDLKDIARGAYDLIRETVNQAQCQSKPCEFAPKQAEKEQKAEVVDTPSEENCKTDVAPVATALGATAAIAATGAMAMEDEQSQASEQTPGDVAVDVEDVKPEGEPEKVVDAPEVQQTPAPAAVAQEPEKKE